MTQGFERICEIRQGELEASVRQTGIKNVIANRHPKPGKAEPGR